MSQQHNPLNLGNPLGSGSNAPTTSTNVVTGASKGDNKDQASAAHSNVVSEPGQSLFGRLKRIRTAPQTVPLSATAHVEGQTNIDPAKPKNNGLPAPKVSPSNSDRSSTPTVTDKLYRAGTLPHQEVPASLGGLHGNTIPDGKRDDYGQLHEKDHQAAGMGGKTGPHVAALARQELGIEGDISDEKVAQRARERFTVDQETGNPRKIERTTTGTKVSRHLRTASGQDTSQTFGFVPVTRMTSQPPAVGPWGGSAPEGVDAEEGLNPVMSREEEEDREKLRQQKGPDPWAVKFEPGEAANPKVGYFDRT